MGAHCQFHNPELGNDFRFVQRYCALTAVNWGRDTRPSLVASLSKVKTVDVLSRLEASELWLYRRKVEPRAAPDRDGK